MVHGTPNIFFRNAENFSSQYAEAMLPKKRCLAFDFKFKKFSIKQAFFINEIFSSCVKAPKQKKRIFFKVFARFSTFFKI